MFILRSVHYLSARLMPKFAPPSPKPLRFCRQYHYQTNMIKPDDVEEVGCGQYFEATSKTVEIWEFRIYTSANCIVQHCPWCSYDEQPLYYFDPDPTEAKRLITLGLKVQMHDCPTLEVLTAYRLQKNIPTQGPLQLTDEQALKMQRFATDLEFIHTPGDFEDYIELDQSK